MPFLTGLYSGLTYLRFFTDEQSVQELDDFINLTVEANKQDSIVSIFMMPYAFYSYNSIMPIVETRRVRRPNTVAGYKPRNNKLFTFPYMFLTVDTLNASHNYRYEFGREKTSLHFVMTSCMSDNPEIVISPMGYNGSQGDSLETDDINFTESVTCSGFPQCPFIIDSYRAWLAQKATGDILGLIGNTVTTGASIGTAIGSGNPQAGIQALSGIIGISQQINDLVLSATAGSKARGNTGAVTDVGGGAKGVYYKSMSVTYEFASLIDDFFDRYGYACGRIKIPNRNVRKQWTYTKTREVSIRGQVPADAMAKIKSIYNNGITFWRHGESVGDYWLDNTVEREV